MKKKFIPRGRHVTVPIIGDTVSEIRFHKSGPILIFEDTVNGESELKIDDVMTFHQYGADLRLEGGYPEQFYPLLSLLGTTVVDAWAHAEGPLEISFSNEAIVRVLTETRWEAYHFQYPRPMYSVKGIDNRHISIEGEKGGLIIF